MQDGQQIIEDINVEDSPVESSSNDINESVEVESVDSNIESSDSIDTVEDNELESEPAVNNESETSIETSSQSVETVEETVTEQSEIVESQEEETSFEEETIETESDMETYVTPEYIIYTADTSNTDNSELYQEMIAEQQVTNELLTRINDQNDFIIGVGVTLIICCIAYSILEKFCRF